MNGRGIRNEAPETDKKQQEEQIMFGLALRDKSRYGRFVTECEGIGKVTVKIEPYSFGEIFSVYKDGKQLTWLYTLDEESEWRYDETDDYIIIDEYRIRIPFEKRLRVGEGDPCHDEYDYTVSDNFYGNIEEEKRLAGVLKELIVNNSNLEAEEDDTVMFENVKSVIAEDDDVVIYFNNKKVVLRVSVRG